MKFRLTIFALLLSFLGFTQYKGKQGFIENKGQILDQKRRQNKDVLYLLNTTGLNVQLRKNGFSYDVYETKKVPLSDKQKKQSTSDKSEYNLDYNFEYIFHRVDIDFEQANPDVQLISEGKSTDFDNYYNIPSEPNGILAVHKFKKVTYQNIYPNIDVVFFIPEDKSKVVEYNFVVKPQGKISDIRLKFNGAKTTLEDTKIKMNLRFGQMEETLPMSWTEENSSKSAVAIQYKQLAKNVYGFEGVNDVAHKTTVIDPTPTRLWGTYYGGTDVEFPSDITTDQLNNVYISGITQSYSNIATSGTHQSYLVGQANLFIVRLTSNGLRTWGTYFSVENNLYNSQKARLCVDSNLNVYFTGNELNNTSIGTPGTFQPIKNTLNDIYLIKLSPLGTKLWGTYFGGSGNDFAYSICKDPQDNVYIGGATSSQNTIASSGAFQTNNNSTGSFQDAFLAKFDPTGNRMWSTYYGGTGSESFNSLDISNNGYIYAVGAHHSLTNIATPGSYQPTTTIANGGMIVKFDLNGNRIWGTYIADNSTNLRGKLRNSTLFIIGNTKNQTSIGTPNTYMPAFITSGIGGALLNSGENACIISFNVNTQQKDWGTYFGEQIIDLDVNLLNEIYIAGSTSQTNGIATSDGYMPTKNSYIKSYMVKFNSLGQRVWGTYYGGNLAEQIGFLNIDLNQDIYLYGMTNGSTSGIATPGTQQTTIGSITASDTYLAKFKECNSTSSVTSNSPICPGNTIQLNASLGTTYSWSGPNGFTSNLQNPVINNANTSQSGIYSCTITGTGGCDGTATLNVLVGDQTKPIPAQTTLPTINGDCNTVVTAPTATDNCSGLITATTTDPLSYSIPGTYTVHWNYNDGNGNLETQNQTIIITATPLPVANSSQSFCIQENATLSTINITGQNIKWYDALTGGNIIPNNTILQNGVTYYASQTINTCESQRLPITVNVYTTPAPVATSPQSFCSTQNATVADITITGTNIKWYSSISSTIPLPSTTVITNGTIYYATQTLNGCESTNRVPISIVLINTLNANDYSVELCDNGNDGKEIVDISQYNSNLYAAGGATFSYYNSQIGANNQISSDLIVNFNNYNLSIGTKEIYVRIVSSNGCYQVVKLNLTLFSNPVIPIDPISPICEGSSITLTAGNGTDTYLWSTGETTPSITISNGGNYAVTVTQNHPLVSCSSTKNFIVVNSNKAIISKILTSDWTNNQNEIIVLITSNSFGNYEYSLDGIHFQDSNVFSNLSSGEYVVYVRDKNGCGVSSESVYLMMYPKFFTPNGDGYNDYWKIKYSNEEPNLIIYIHDRFGKLLKQFSNDSQGWDGTYLGQPLPADDYWFTVTRANGKEYRAHFSLKR